MTALDIKTAQAFQPLLEPARYKGAYGGRGSGKCLAVGTPVMMADGGILPVEAIRRGDRLMGPDGRPRTVLGTTRGFGPLYRVKQAAAGTYVVNDQHLLSLRRGAHGAGRYPGPDVVHVTPGEYLEWSERRKASFFGYKAGPIEMPKDTGRLSVEPIGDGEYAGFELDGDHLFCLADGTVTHNSHFFAELAVEKAVVNPGARIVCVREVQRSLKDSVKRLVEDKIEALKVGKGFKVHFDHIVGPGGGVILFQGMQDHTAESIKSLEGFDVAYVEEAQTLSGRSLEFLRPTIRTPGSELWFSWNPRSASDPVDQLLRGKSPPEDAKVIRVSWKDNPFFPEVLEQERQHDAIHNRDRYAHIWEGEYEPVAIGAIWNRDVIQQNRRDEAPTLRRVVVAVDPAISSEDLSNEHGILVCATGEDGRGYVLEDATLKGSPHQWANRAIAAFDAYEADAVVIEINQGGDMVRETLRTHRPTLPVIEVRATKGKHVRAEPIAALYSLGRISHVGTFPELEDQMCNITASGYEGEGSPDRADALVWALTELFPAMITRTEKKKHREPPMSQNAWMAS